MVSDVKTWAALTGSILALLGTLVTAFISAFTQSKVTRLKAELDQQSQRDLESIRQDHARELEKLRSEIAALNEQMKAGLEHRVYVSKAKIDIELQAYRDLWNKLTNLQAMGVGFWVPLSERATKGALSPSDVEAENALDAITNAYQEFHQFRLVQSPFIAPEIDECLSEEPDVPAAIRGIALSVFKSACGEKAFVDNPAETQRLLNSRKHELARRIRERLNSVSIVT